jgi:hypothetical protein
LWLVALLGIPATIAAATIAMLSVQRTLSAGWHTLLRLGLLVQLASTAVVLFAILSFATESLPIGLLIPLNIVGLALWAFAANRVPHRTYPKLTP